MSENSKGPAPSDIDAEESLIGLALWSPSAMTAASSMVMPGDFYDPMLAIAWDGAIQLWRSGEVIDAVALHAVRPALDQSRLVTLVARTPSGSAANLAKRIAEVAAARRMLIAAKELIVDIERGETWGALDRHRERLSEVGNPSAGGQPSGLWSLDSFLDRPDEEQSPWVIPRLFRAGWRVMIVAPEGTAKSMIFRQIAICAGQGIHPFSFVPTQPVITLLVDLENPSDAIVETCTPIRVQARTVRAGAYQEHRAWLWHRPQGMNLRSHVGRAEFEAVLQFVKPQIVCLGPIYKAYRVGARENDELASGEVQSVLDEFRTRFGFALLLEHHAPKKQAGPRELAPYGSSLWLRWPEIGIKLIPVTPECQQMTVDRWRGDRMKNSWPNRIDRGGVWPWTGYWESPDRPAF